MRRSAATAASWPPPVPEMPRGPPGSTIREWVIIDERHRGDELQRRRQSGPRLAAATQAHDGDQAAVRCD
ncbi:MAG: hypothetical protein U0232_31785 [Thermomicrobiales bacterium]